MAEEVKQETQQPAAENNETGNAPGGDSKQDAPEKSGEKLFTQADLEAKIEERLKRERKQAETKAERERQEADERRKVEQGEWQKLAEERKTQLEALAPKGELADRLQEIVAKQLDTEIETWPESVRAIMPNAESPLLERLEWAERTRPLAQELMVAKGQGGGNGANAGTRFPAQGTGGSNPPTTTKDVAVTTLNKAYASRKDK